MSMRRVAALATQVAVRPASATVEPAPAPAALPEPPQLSEAELKSFVETGYVVVHADFSDEWHAEIGAQAEATCLLYTSPSPRDATLSRMPSSA